MTKKSTHWKWKQWKPEKVTDWCKNVAKSSTIRNQTLIVRNGHFVLFGQNAYYEIDIYK